MTSTETSIQDQITELAALAELENPTQQNRDEYAIRLPNPRWRWWRKLSTRVANPNHHTPTIYTDLARARDELFDVRAMATTVFGVTEDYQPQLMVRHVRLTGTGVTTSEWEPVPADADTEVGDEAEAVQR